jgi:glycosyltransferase involved in cell wall biosynthesis
MRVALLTDGIYPYVIGGMQKHSYFLVKFFAANGVYVDLYHINQSDKDVPSLDIFSEAERKYIQSFLFEFPSCGKLPGHYLKESYAYSTMLYEKMLKHELPDFIYAKGYTGWRFIEEKKKGNPLPPIGIRLHGYEIFQPTKSLKVKLWNKLYKKLVLLLNKESDFVYSYGGKLTQTIIDNTQISFSKIIEIPTGIENNWINKKISTPEGTIRFVFVGRYDIRKGIKELNQAILKLLKVSTDFSFEFIGPIPEKEKIKAGNIYYHGSISNQEDIKSILQKADVLVVPSHSEGMPNVIMEGMASGCAILATDVGAVSLLVTSENGMLIPPMNHRAILEAIRMFIVMDKEKLFQMKLNSVSNVKEKFLWEKVILKEIETIQNFISHH